MQLEYLRKEYNDLSEFRKTEELVKDEQILSLQEQVKELLEQLSEVNFSLETSNVATSSQIDSHKVMIILSLRNFSI